MPRPSRQETPGRAPTTTGVGAERWKRHCPLDDRHDRTSDKQDPAHGTPCTTCIGSCGLLEEPLSGAMRRAPDSSPTSSRLWRASRLLSSALRAIGPVSAAAWLHGDLSPHPLPIFSSRSPVTGRKVSREGKRSMCFSVSPSGCLVLTEHPFLDGPLSGQTTVEGYSFCINI